MKQFPNVCTLGCNDTDNEDALMMIVRICIGKQISSMQIKKGDSQ